jgi:hypothetical protein
VKRLRIGVLAALAASLIVVFGFVGKAHSIGNCPFGLETATECQISGLETQTGVFAFGKTLHVLAGGHIDASAGGITLNITGDLLMDNGGVIEADDDNVATPNTGASDITITASGNADLAAGSMISARNTIQGGSGGDISITITGDMAMHGTTGPLDNCRANGTGDPLVYATPSLGAVITAKGSGSSGFSPAGNITIHVGFYGVPPTGTFTMERCSLVDVSSSLASAGEIEIISGHSGDVDGLVLSESTVSGGGSASTQVRGGGPITIKAGCDLTVSDTGVVSSKGQDPGADLVLLKACDVVIYGVVQSTTTAGHALPAVPPNKCNTDAAAHPLGAASGFTACVRIIGRNVTIDASGAHNGNVNVDGVRNPMKGWIDIFATKTLSIIGDPAPAPKWAVSANGATGQSGASNSFGGLITIKNTGQDGGGAVTTSGQAVLMANTNLPLSGNGSDGGDVRIQAKTDVSLDGSYLEAVGFGGSNSIGGQFAIKAFNGAITSGGDASGHIFATATGGTPGTITLTECAPTDTYLGTVNPAATQTNNVCGGAPTLPGDAQALVDANEPIWNACANPGFTVSGFKYQDFIGGTGLIGWKMHLFNAAGTIHQVATTDATGFFQFVNVPNGSYTICEELQNGWSQVAPAVGANCLVPGDPLLDNPTPGPIGYSITVNNADVTGNDFANTRPPTCKEDPNRAATIDQQVDKNGKSHGGLAPVFTTVQAAYDAANSGDTIGVYTNTYENVNLNGAKTLTITQCESAKVIATDNTLPVWWVHSSGKLTIIGPDSQGGTIGWLVTSNGNDLKAIRAYSASSIGVQITGNSNSVSFNEVKGSPTGIQVNGNSNTLTNGSIDGNGAGVVVAGNNNTIQQMKVYSNTGDGLKATGTGTFFKQDTAELNGGNGFNVAASATGTKLQDNKSNTGSNGGSKENGLKEYFFGVNVNNAGSNKKDNANFTTGLAGGYE